MCLKMKEDNIYVGISVVALILTVMVGVSSCSRQRRNEIHAWDKPVTIKCYSGGVLILEDASIDSVNSSDSYSYTSATTGKLVRTNADCVVIERDAPIEVEAP